MSTTVRTGWTRDIPDRFLLGADLSGMALMVLFWAAGWAVYVPHICRNEPSIRASVLGEPRPPTQSMVNTVTWRCDFGDGSGLYSVVDHLPVVWTVCWLLLLLAAARAAVRHQRALMW